MLDPDRLTEIRDLLAKATPRPWHRNVWVNYVLDANEDTVADCVIRPDETAALIVALVNAAPNLLAAAETVHGPVAAHIEDVLTRHARDPEPIALTLHMDEPCQVCDEDGHLVNVCTGCYPMWDDMPGHVVWPCVEAKAALALRAVLAAPTDHHNPEEAER